THLNMLQRHKGGQQLQQAQRSAQVISPHITAVNHAGDENLVLGEAELLNGCNSLDAANQIETEAVYRQVHQVGVDICDVIEVGVEDDAGVAFFLGEGGIYLCCGSRGGLVHTRHQDWFINLDPARSLLG